MNMEATIAKRKLKMNGVAISIFAFIIIVGLLGAGCGNIPASVPADFPAAERTINTGIVIEYDSNLLMNKYDIRVIVDGERLGIQKQGEKILYELLVAAELHELILREHGNDKNETSVSFDAADGNYYYYFVKAKSGGIEIERQDIMDYDEALMFVGMMAD